MVIDETTAGFRQQETPPPVFNIMKRKGVLKRSVTGSRHLNGSVKGDCKLKMAKCTPFEVYISNGPTGGKNLWD